MPKLKALGRLWPISSDDLCFPALIGLTLTCLWWMVLMYIYHVHPWDPSCPGGQHLQFFYRVFLSLALVYMGLMACMVYTTTRGSLINAWPRRHTVVLIKAKSVYDIFRLAFIAWCVKVVYFEDMTGCDFIVVRGLFYTVHFSWLVNILAVFAFPYIFCPFFDKPKKNRRHQLQRTNSFKEDINTIARGYRRLLSKQWQNLKTYLKLESHPGIHGASANVTDYLFRDRAEDIAPSDILAGLIVLRREQKRKWKNLLDDQFTPAPPCNDDSSCDSSSEFSGDEQVTDKNTKQDEGGKLSSVQPQPWMTEENALYYQKYAKATYGWPKYLMANGMPAACHLAKWICGDRPKLAHPSRVVDDGPLLLNTRVIQLLTGLEMENIVYVSFFHKWAEIPFYVALDHTQKTIVVAIQGTTSFDDIVTDIDVFESGDIHIEGVPNARVHEGMLNAAQCIKQKLTGYCTRKHGRVQIECIPDKPILDMARDRLEDMPGVNPEEYKLMIVGHSLGASVGGVLAILMQQEERFKDLMCFSYGPVGGLVSSPLARLSEQFTCSVVLQDDVVSRMNKVNAYDLKIKLLKTIRDCDIPKHVLFTNFWKRKILGFLGVPCPDVRSAVKQNRKVSVPHSWQRGSAAELLVKDFQGKIDDNVANMELKKSLFPAMNVPGCILFIRAQNQNITSNGQDSLNGYKSKFIRGDSPLLEQIQLSRNMWAHHSLKLQGVALQQLIASSSKSASAKLLNHNDRASLT